MIRIKNYKEVVDEVKGYLKDYLELNGVVVRGRAFKCFHHDDTHASAGLTNDGKGYKCFGCDAKGDIFNVYSFFEGKNINGQDFYYAIKELADIFHVQYEQETIEKLVQEKEYEYVDENNVEIYKIIKYHKEDEDGNVVVKSNGKLEKIFNAFSKVGDKWEKGMTSEMRYIYNLSNVATAINKGEDIYFVEGEKCVELIKCEFGFTATTIAFGAKSWCEPYITNYKSQLKNARLVLIPDNDESGYKLMERVSKDLKDSVKSIKIVKLTDDIKLPIGGDVEEWIELGGNRIKLLQLKEQSPELIEEEKIWYQQDEKGRIKINTGLLSRYLVNNYPSIYSAGGFYLYKNGVYKQCKPGEVQGIIKNKIDDKFCKMNLIKDVEGLWQIDRKVLKSPEELNIKHNIINIRNGLYDVISGELLQHTPSHLSTIQFDVDFNSKASGDNFIKFLNKVFPDVEIQRLVQEIAGYTMSTYNVAKKFFIFQGPRDSGKTTFLNAIMSIITEEYLSHVNMQNLNDRFNKAELFGKIANIVNELPDKGIDDVGFIKALVGQDPIMAEKKGKDPFNFVNKAKLIFACNKLPTNYGDKSDSFYNKVIIVKFTRQLSNDEIDVMLPGKLEKEKEFIFLWAMEGLKRLINNGFKFTEPEATLQLRNDYKLKSNNVLAFIEDCCELKDSEEVISTELYSEYKKYCRENNYTALGRNKFLDEVSNNYVGKVTSRLVTSKRLKGFVGIRLK